MTTNKNIEESKMSTETVVVKDSKPNRPARKPVTRRGKLGAKPIPGYHLRFINTDEKDNAYRLHDFKEAYWEPVLRKEQLGPDCDRPNDPYVVESSSRPMLVKIPDQYFEEDQAAKVERNKKTLAAKVKNEQHEFGSVSIS